MKGGRPAVRHMASRASMKNAVRRGLRARSNAIQTRRQGGRRVFSSGAPAPARAGPRTIKRYPLVGKVLAEAYNLLQPLIRELEQEERSGMSDLTALAYQLAGCGIHVDCENYDHVLKSHPLVAAA